jgi:hypothetical protein
LIVVIVVVGAVVGAVWLLARRAAWSDARPGLAPLSVYGDWPHVPTEGMSRSAELSGVGRSEAKTDRLDTHDGGTRTGHPGGV